MAKALASIYAGGQADGTSVQTAGTGVPAAPGAAPPADPAPPPLNRMLRGPLLAGAVIIGVFFFGLGGWSVMAPLASAAIAPGVVSPDGSRRTVQHLEGGIIRELLVQDGRLVRAGDPLVVLEDIRARAEYEALQKQYNTLTATEARLIAERDGAAAVTFPDWLQAQSANPAVAETLDAQRNLFRNRLEAHEGRGAILGQRIAQLDEEIGGLEAQITSQTIQLGLIQEEIDAVQTLLEQGLERRPRLLALQRDQARIEGTRAELQAQIARARQQIGEAELEILTMDTTRLEEVNTRLSEIQAELAGLEEEMRSSEDVLSRTAILAPVSGTVVEMRHHTRGGVIAPGEPILDIVPLDEELLIDARVAPNDIDVVHPGLEAQVLLSAYRQRNLPRIAGTLRTVSADAIQDPETGQSYFKARIEVSRAELDRLGEDIELSAGMPAEVMILTGEQSAFDWIIGPFLDSMRRSFKES